MRKQQVYITVVPLLATACLIATACSTQASTPTDTSMLPTVSSSASSAVLTPKTITNATTVPAAPLTSSPSLAKAASVYKTMTYTRYTHKYVIKPTSGIYQWDCVGYSDWVLSKSAPNAWKAMHTTLGIKPGYVPTPPKWASYLQTSTSPSWLRIQTITNVKPGDYIIYGANPATKFVGHSVIVASNMVAVGDGSYVFSIYDSTGGPHGTKDTRITDARSGANPATKTVGSGTGSGVMRIFTNPNGTFNHAQWSPVSGGPTMRGVSITVGRALN